MSIRIAIRPQFFTVTQAAKAEGITRQRMLKLIALGRIAGAEKVGGRWVLPKGYAVLPCANKRGKRPFEKIKQEKD